VAGAWDEQAALDDLRAAQAADRVYALVDALSEAIQEQQGSSGELYGISLGCRTMRSSRACLDSSRRRKVSAGSRSCWTLAQQTASFAHAWLWHLAYSSPGLTVDSAAGGGAQGLGTQVLIHLC
jgi:hypothetical protein